MCLGTPAPLKDGRRLNYSKQLNNDENGKKFSCEEENIQQLSIDGLTTYLKFQACWKFFINTLNFVLTRFETLPSQ